MTDLEQVVSEAVKILFSSGWTGVLLGLGLVVLVALLKIYAPKLPKPEAPKEEEIPHDEWETDPDHPGGGMGGG